MPNILDDQTNSNSNGNRANFQRHREMWVRQVLASDISPTAKVIGVAISIHMNGDYRQAWPSHSALARMCSVEKRTSERAVKELEKAALLAVSRKANCSNRYEMRRVPTGESVGTDEDDASVPTAIVLPPDEDGTTPPTWMSPEPLNITSERTSDIEPLIEPLKEEAPPRSSSFLENSSLVVAAKAERKESGEQSEPTKIAVSEHLARLVKERWVQ
jgi:Helix-turn-helix domain